MLSILGSFAWRAAILVLVASCILGMGFVIYQCYFHPLSRYPGPFLARLTNLYSAYHAWRGDIHTDMWRMHERYGRETFEITTRIAANECRNAAGNVVRYAPNRLLFNDAQAAKEIYGNKGNVVKSQVYDTLVHRAGNTLTIRNKAEHARRRRIMSPGFSDSSVKILEPRILAQVDKLIDILSETSTDQAGGERKEHHIWTQPRDMAVWCDRHAFDLMSNLIYSASFDTLTKDQHRFVPSSIESSNIRMSVILQAPELTARRLDKKLFPGSILARNKFLKFVGSVIATRSMTVSKGKDDIFSFLQSARDSETGKGLGIAELLGESATLIVAGSDTTSTTMAGLFHYLTCSPSAYDRAAAEVRDAFSCPEEVSLGSKLGSCVYLRACIEETLRLSPPTGSALWREVSQGGACIGGHWIPSGFDVGTGIYAIHHNPAFHSSPFEFRPERLMRDGRSREAFMPFSFGMRGCIGKGLAMAEIMLTMSAILLSYDFRRAAEDATAGEYRLKDHITAAKTGPILQFRKRDKLGGL